MSIVVLFGLLVLGVVGWWMFARQLTAKPWERAQRDTDDDYGAGGLAIAPARIGLWLFLAVVTSLFGLLISAYGMRIRFWDWRPVAQPSLLWLNTAMLIASSIAFQWTRGAAKRGNASGVKAGLIVSGLFAFAFLAGQLLAWRQLNASGQFAASSAAIAFFYLFTGLHGLHLLGGLAVWGRTTIRIWRDGASLAESRLSIELCSVYWHFLLLVWLILFAVLLLQCVGNVCN
ncbi:MAG: cytochrome c oxidase subunit 3 [Burkholderiales bacterium]